MFRKWRINATVGRNGDDFGQSSTSCLTHSFLFLPGSPAMLLVVYIGSGSYCDGLYTDHVFLGTRGIGVREQKGVQHGQRLTYL